jgi:hypothetical protein
MERLALPIIAGTLVVLLILAIWVSLRNPPRFWMDEKRVPDRNVRLGRRRSGATSSPRGDSSEATETPSPTNGGGL